MSELSRSLGMEVNLELRQGGNISGVLGAVTADTVILEHWDKSKSGPSGEPFTMSIDQMLRIVIP